MQPQTPTPPPPDYDFIMNPAQAPKPRLLAASSLKQRLLIAGGSLVVLLIVATIVINLLSASGSYFPSLLVVAQEQQQLIHLTGVGSNSSQTQPSTANSNLAVTVKLALSSQQSNLLTYLKQNKHSVSQNQLNQGVNAALDQQLTTAAQAGNYDATFTSLLQTQLQNYQKDLAAAYAKDKGPKGRQLLNDDYNQTQLLLNALSSH